MPLQSKEAKMLKMHDSKSGEQGKQNRRVPSPRRKKTRWLPLSRLYLLYLTAMITFEPTKSSQLEPQTTVVSLQAQSDAQAEVSEIKGQDFSEFQKSALRSEEIAFSSQSSNLVPQNLQVGSMQEPEEPIASGDIESRKLTGTCTIINNSGYANDVASTKSYNDGGISFDATTTLVKSAGCDPSSTIVHSLIGTTAEDGRHTANINSSGGAWNQVGPKWDKTQCWGGNWRAFAQSAVFLAGKVQAIIRYAASRDCRTRVTPALYEEGTWSFRSVGSDITSLPRLEWNASTITGSTSVKWMYTYFQYSFTTPELVTNAYQSTSLIAHHLYVIPEGKWHYGDCEASIAAVLNCFQNTLSAYEIQPNSAKPMSGAIRSNWSFTCETYQVRTDKQDVWDGHARVFHVITDASSKGSWNLISYNWDTEWLVEIKDLHKDDIKLFSNLDYRLDPSQWYLPGYTKGWVITKANYNTQDWQFLRSATLQASDQANAFADNLITFDSNGMGIYLAGILEFFIDSVTLPADDCFNKGYAVSIEPYTSKMTWHATNPFTTPGTLQKCTLRVCQKVTNSLNSAENIEEYTDPLLLQGCQGKEICFADDCNSDEHVQRPGFTWGTAPIIVHYEYEPYADFKSESGTTMYPYITPTVSCFERMGTGIPHIYKDYSMVPFDGAIQPTQIRSFPLSNPNAVAKTFKIIFQYISEYCGLANKVTESPEFTFINQSYIAADFVEFDSLTVNDPASLKLNTQQTIENCQPSQCDACLPSCADPCVNPCPPCNPALSKQSCTHTLTMSMFTIKQAKAKVDIPPFVGDICNYCEYKSIKTRHTKDQEVILPVGEKSLSVSSVTADGISIVPTTDWEFQPFKVDCGRWSLKVEGKTVKHTITISNTAHPFISKQIEVECNYPVCSNLQAETNGSFKPAISGGTQIIDPSSTVFYIKKDKTAKSIEFLPLELYCTNHSAQKQIQYFLSIPGEPPDKAITSSEALLKYGIRVENNNIIYFTADINLIGHIVKVSVRQESNIENSWYTLRMPTIEYKDGRCRLTQEEIDSYMAPVIIELRTTIAGKSVTKPMGDIFTLGPEALQTTEHAFYCGLTQYQWYDPTNQQPNVNADFEKRQVTLKPDIDQKVGSYDKASIRFSYVDYPELHFDVIILSIIDPCEVYEASFSPDTIKIDYFIGSDGTSRKISDLKSQPQCDLTIQTHSLDYAQRDLQLLEFDIVTKAIIVKQTNLLKLYNTRVSATLTIYVHQYPMPIYLNIEVSYKSNGPEFVGQRELKFPTVFCSFRGSSYEFKMPDIVAKDQQDVRVVLVQDQLVGDIFKLNRYNQTVTLLQEFKERISGDIVLEKDCPVYRHVVITFQLFSNVIGSNQVGYVVKFQEDPTHKFGNLTFLDDDEEGKPRWNNSLPAPTAEIQSISVTGLVKLKFAWPLEPIEDLNQLKKRRRGSLFPYLQVKVEPVLGQDYPEVAFSWYPVNFDGGSLSIQIDYDQPHDISMFWELNTIEFVFWDPEGDLFVRAIDQRPIPDGTLASKISPKQLDPRKEEIIRIVAHMISDTGTGTVIFTILLRQFYKFSFNSLLGNVRNLQFVTHLMMMQLVFTASVSYFYSILFEFVTYDYIPTDEIYGAMFDFDSEPYSDEADLIGYQSRYVVENTGSLLLYLMIIGAKMMLVYAIIKKCSLKCTKIRKWAHMKRDDFVWGGAIEFFSELYLSIAFSLGINSSHVFFNSASETFNNLFAIALTVAFVVVPPIQVFQLWKQLGKSEIPDNQVEKAENPQPVSELLNEGGEKEEAADLESMKNDGHTTQRLIIIEEEKDHDKSYGGDTNHHSEEDESLSALPIPLVPKDQAESLVDDSVVELPILKAPENKAQLLVAQHRSQLDAIQKQERADAEVKGSFGGFTSSLVHRSRLTRKQNVRFVTWSYLRRLLLTIVILSLYSYPVMQVTLSVLINLADLTIILHYRPYLSMSEHRSEVINGVASLLILYCLMLFTEQFMDDKKTMRDIGDLLITITCLNLAINVLPELALLLQSLYRRYFLKYYNKYKQRQAEKRKLKALREQLRARSGEEQEYGRHIEIRANAAAESRRLFSQYEQMYTDGRIDNKGVAMRTQQHLNLESQLDSDYLSPRDDQQSNPYPVGAPVLLNNSQDLIDQFPVVHSRSTGVSDFMKDFTLEPIAENTVLIERESKESESDSESRPGSMSSQNYTKTDFWGNTRIPNADTEEHKSQKKSGQPSVEEDRLEDGELLLFKNSIFVALMLFDRELHEQKKHQQQQMTTKQELIKALDGKVERWIGIVVDICQTKLDDIDQESIHDPQDQQIEAEAEDILNGDKASEKEQETEQSKRVKFKLQVSDILYELVEIDTMEQQTRNDMFSQTERDIALLDFAQKLKIPTPPVPDGTTDENLLSIKDRADIRFKQQIANKVKQKQKTVPRKV